MLHSSAASTHDAHTAGAWLIHHDQQLSAVKSNEFENITTAGRAARLLSYISKELAWTVSEDRVHALARANGIKKHEVRGLLVELEESGLINRVTGGVAVLGVTQANLFKHANAVFEHQNPTGLERAALDLAERASDTPVEQGEIAEELADVHHLIREGRDDITDVDLWTYTRASVHARHIAIVDIKNKKRAKGYERVIWFRGLQSALKADEAVTGLRWRAGRSRE